MSLERAGGIALAIGALAYIALMAVHPSHAGGHPIIGTFSLSGVVHATALVLKPVLLFGFIVFTREQGFTRPLPLLALSFYALASVFTMLAGTMSGLVFPYLVEAAHAPGANLEDAQLLGRYTTWLNRSFAQIHTDMVSIAILLWSIGWAAKSPLAWIARVIGIVVSLGVLGWHLSGTMNLEARQGALWVTLAHGIWVLLVAATLLTKKEHA
jgi:uncharacterized membrane protein (Fun14 family)